MTWAEWRDWRESRRAALRKHGCEGSSRRAISYDTSERFMRGAFGGRRIPAWAETRDEGGGVR